MPRGGRRQGQQGKAYSNRTDMNQPVRTKKGQEYGEAKRQEEAQEIVTLPQQPPVAPPGTVPGLSDPTSYPDRPVTHGLPLGPGSGPEVLGLDPYDEALSLARELYRRHPYPDLLRMIQNWGG